MKVTYSIQGSALRMQYEAVSDMDTIICLTNHAYFNLGGHDAGAIFEHELKIDADNYLPVDALLLPLEPLAVMNSAFDFTDFEAMSTGLRSLDPQITSLGGFDHHFILNGSGCREVAEVRHPWSGRIMKIATTEPGLQFYTANHIDNLEGKDGISYGKYPAFCLETQHFPNSPNRPEFPSALLKAKALYETTTTYTFSAEAE
jgi:aldose 1-epimerase